MEDIKLDSGQGKKLRMNGSVKYEGGLKKYMVQ